MPRFFQDYHALPPVSALQISPAVISELEAALNGRPRQKDITIGTDMVDGNATGLLEDEDLGDEEVRGRAGRLSQEVEQRVALVTG